MESEKTFTRKQVIELMTKAFETGYKQYEYVEAGLEGKETEQYVYWILLKYISNEEDN